MFSATTSDLPSGLIASPTGQAGPLGLGFRSFTRPLPPVVAGRTSGACSVARPVATSRVKTWMTSPWVPTMPAGATALPLPVRWPET